MRIILNYLVTPEQKAGGIRYWCGDESRFGLKTVTRRVLTIKGVKPIGKVQWKRENFYVFGVVEPKTGERFFWEFSHIDTICFQKFLEEFARSYPAEFHIIQVDNGAFHCSQKLKVPENILLLFQPAHTPQVNPIERLWEELKKDLSWELFDNLDELKVAVRQMLNKLTDQVVASVTGWDFILEALSVSGIS